MYFKILKIVFIIVLTSSSSWSQKQIKTTLSDLFSINQDRKLKNLSIDSELKNSLSKRAPRRIQIPVVIDGEIEILILQKQHFISPNYILRSAHDIIMESTKTLFYSGIVEGQSNSMAFLSIQKNNLSLNINIGKYNWSFTQSGHKSNQLEKVLSGTHTSKRKRFNCSTDAYDKKSFVSKTFQQSENDGIVSVYIEADHELFLQKGSSVTQVEIYIQSLFSHVAHIYANENIDIEISEIKVWESPDPYDVSSSQSALTSFGESLSGNFNGDLAHLFSGNAANHGGKAYIDVLCDKSNAYAYSNLNGNYDGPNDYSWDAFIVAHEIGHNFGSHHTHDCVWGILGDQAIDECGRTNETCSTVDTNATSGTIMSYCHLDPGGISFGLGFGPYPGNLIRNKYNACLANEGINCQSAIEINVNGKYTALGPVKGFGSSQNNADHSNWYTFTAPSDGRIKIFNCSSGVDSRLWVHSGDCDDMMVIANSDDTCGPDGQFTYSSSIPQIYISKGEKIYIEWDDRWSNEGFDFYFKFGESNL